MLPIPNSHYMVPIHCTTSIVIILHSAAVLQSLSLRTLLFLRISQSAQSHSHKFPSSTYTFCALWSKRSNSVLLWLIFYVANLIRWYSVALPHSPEIVVPPNNIHSLHRFVSARYCYMYIVPVSRRFISASHDCWLSFVTASLTL